MNNSSNKNENRMRLRATVVLLHVLLCMAACLVARNSWTNGCTPSATYQVKPSASSLKITCPADITYANGANGISINWTITGSGSSKTYAIYQNATIDVTDGSNSTIGKHVVASGQWTSGTPVGISIGPTALSAGTYTYEINATDGTIVIVDSVQVRVNAGIGGIDRNILIGIGVAVAVGLAVLALAGGIHNVRTQRTTRHKSSAR